MRALGYRTADVPGGVWGVKNRLSPLGFPLFHLSFFLLWVGGTLLSYTRNVGVLSAIEGQAVDTSTAHVVARAASGPSPGLRIAVERVDVDLERGLPVGLGARLALPGEPPRDVRIDDPLVVGATTILVERAGVAPVLRLEDAGAFTTERIAIAARTEGGRNASVRVGSDDLSVEVEAIPVGPEFPTRDMLSRAAVSVRVRRGDTELFAGRMRRGDAVPLPAGRLVLEEIRYWVGLRVVHERGGGLLVAGFLLGVAGIVLRMLWYRREVAVVADDRGLRVAGRAEFFHDGFRTELAAVAAEIGRPPQKRARA